jgi:hypothetical protein
MSDNKREERAPMVSQAMENVRASGALSRRPGARRHRWTLAAPEESENAQPPESQAPGSQSSESSNPENQDEGAADDS